MSLLAGSGTTNFFHLSPEDQKPQISFRLLLRLSNPHHLHRSSPIGVEISPFRRTSLLPSTPTGIITTFGLLIAGERK
ncbi:hypothetical protein K1719_004281 [Acacia pycnantha]|nr:hypothetical protein K1719_004281 [Acacia pycnantha]